MKDKKPISFKRVSGIALNVVFYTLIVGLILFSFATMQLKRNDDIAGFFGRGFLTVLTDSMDGNEDDSFTSNDVIFVNILDDSERADLKVGDVITYFSMDIPGLGIQGFITHRIVDTFSLDGELYLITQGDKVGSFPDNPIHISEARALYTGQFAGAGSALKYLQSPNGFAIFIILPVFLLLIFQGIVLGRNIYLSNQAKIEVRMAEQKEQAQLQLEAEKEKIRQQILAELNTKKEENKPS